MTTPIHSQAKSMTEAQLNAILSGFSEAQKKEFNQLVRLGDSRELAASTVASGFADNSSKMYQIAYYS